VNARRAVQKVDHMKNEQKRCGDAGGRTKSGAPCRQRMNLSPETGLCVFHDPGRKDELRAMVAAGGKAKGEKIRKEKAANPDFAPRAPRSLSEAATFASWLTHAIVTGEVDARVGYNAAFALKAFQSLAEKRDLQREVEKLRAELAEAQKRSPKLRAS
jgi:hypothetical protein